MSKSAKEIYEASLALSNSAVGTTPKAPETPNSKYDQISFVYGSPLRRGYREVLDGRLGGQIVTF